MSGARQRTAPRDRCPVSSELEWLAAPADALAFERSDGLRCVVNFADSPLPVGAFGSVVLASEPLVDGLLTSDAAAWGGVLAALTVVWYISRPDRRGPPR